MLARMRAGKDAARMERPAPDYPPTLPELRRRIVIQDFDFGEKIHTLDLYRTNRVDCGIMARTAGDCESPSSSNQSAIGAPHGYAEYYRRTSADTYPLRPKHWRIYAHCACVFKDWQAKRPKQIRPNDAKTKCGWIHSVLSQSDKRSGAPSSLAIYDWRMATWSNRPHQRRASGQQMGEPSVVRCNTESAKSTQSKGRQHSRSSWCNRGQGERKVHRSNHAQLQAHSPRKVRHGRGSLCRISWCETGDTHSLHDLAYRVVADGVEWKKRVG